MDSKKLLIILMLAVLVLTVGCKKGGETIVSTSTPFIGGQNGLLMSFIPGAPPEYIFDNGNGQFGITIRLENVGESDIMATDGYVEIIGVNPVDVGVTQADLKKSFSNDMTAAKKNFDGTVLAGGQSLVEFGGLKYVPDLHGNTNIILRANLCYNYLTQTTTKICVKEDLLSDVEGKDICQVNEQKETFNSGGPIQITNFKEAPIGTDKVQVSFVIEHVGDPSDTFFNMESTECDNIITNTDRHVVWLDVVSEINGQRPKCDGLEEAQNDGSFGKVRLFDGAPRVVTCTVDISGAESTFEDLFEANIYYKYMQSIQQNVEVRDVATS